MDKKEPITMEKLEELAWKGFDWKEGIAVDRTRVALRILVEQNKIIIGLLQKLVENTSKVPRYQPL